MNIETTYKSNQKRHLKPLHILYLISLFLVVLLLLCIFLTRTQNYNDPTRKNYDDISHLWHLSPDSSEVLDLRNLGNYCDADDKVLYLYCKVPELSHDTTLFFRSKDVYTSLYIDEKKIYETSVPDSRFYNKSPGNLWNEVLLDESYSGKILTLKIDIVYDTSAITADSFFLGNGTNIIRHFVHKNIFDIIVSLMMILTGLMYIAIDCITQNRVVYMGHGLLYLGFYALLIGLWCLLETNVIQFFVSDQRILQLCNNLLMIFAMLPLFLFLDYSYNVFQKKLTLILCLIDIGYAYACLFVQFTGITDIHNLIGGIPIATVLSIVLFFGWIVHSGIECKRKKLDPLPIFLQMAGVGSLMISVTFELLNTTQGDSDDRAAFLRVGSFFFAIFFGLSNQVQTKKLVVNGLRYNVVKDLAYSDGLTSIGNRTAFFEKLESYANSNFRQIGVVYLDINNLKPVNDTLGHEYGDELIKAASSIIEQSYGEHGECYRIGGDEFCVIIDKASPASLYDSATSIFEALMKEFNESPGHPFKIEIAQGFSICDKMTQQNLRQCVKDADAAMYENKKEIKSTLSQA